MAERWGQPAQRWAERRRAKEGGCDNGVFELRLIVLEGGQEVPHERVGFEAEQGGLLHVHERAAQHRCCGPLNL